MKNLSDELEDPLGFFQTFGCTSRTEEDMRLAILSLLNGEDWLEEHGATFEFDVSIIEQCDIQREVFLDEEIQASIESSPYEAGVWYQSGKTFFRDGDDDNVYLVEIVPTNGH